LGFFGVIVLTIRQTPLFCGEPLISDSRFSPFDFALGRLTNWFIVGIVHTSVRHDFFGGFKITDLFLKLL
jgi:hypothetical protein